VECRASGPKHTSEQEQVPCVSECGAVSGTTTAVVRTARARMPLHSEYAARAYAPDELDKVGHKLVCRVLRHRFRARCGRPLSAAASPDDPPTHTCSNTNTKHTHAHFPPPPPPLSGVLSLLHVATPLRRSGSPRHVHVTTSRDTIHTRTSVRGHTHPSVRSLARMQRSKNSISSIVLITIWTPQTYKLTQVGWAGL
jgi:hypothetical protein